LETVGGKPIRICMDCQVECFCEELLPMWFVKNKGSKHGYRNICIPCAVKRNEQQPKQKDWKTDHQTKKRYGIDKETYKQRMSTSSSCEVCGSTKELCYDHDHKTMEFRGILCRGCNRSIGQLGDSLEGLLKAVNYLKRKHTDGRNQTSSIVSPKTRE
jgi:Recombination endonuclease VII